ncbi:hypothetical protein K470DRAFT_271788 [Piedraia hortae CBS 480.64]|uniref:NACHT domain-containing protein n=1 Tax=Piedraia hortae CBS 480.64 TaxID=1314780 RepID=A0A6A7BVZ4_9PEZI|nr:hypothetical protein K470DRAFT_271788 [Piedraia hortae CBS 480.64]
MPQWTERLKSKYRSHTSTSQSSASASQPSQTRHVSVRTSAPVLAPKNSFQDQGRLLRDAVAQLSADDRKFVEEQLGPNSDLERDAAEVLALRGQNQTKRSHEWMASIRKINRQIMQFMPVVDVASNVAPEVLSLPWAGIRSLLMVIQNVHVQSESILDGIETVLDTNRLLAAYLAIYREVDATSSIEYLYNNIVKLYGLILCFLAHAHNTCDMNRLERMVHSLTGEVIPNFKDTHNRMLETIEIHRPAVNDEVSKKQQTWVNKQLEALSKAQEEINQGVKGVQKTLDLSALRYAKRAAYDSRDYSSHSQDGDFQLCLDGTRVDITETIQKWATTDDEKRVFWLSGKAGTGKSTIARTVAHELAKQGYLVGSFFFKRGGGELSNAQYLFPTIARQMAYSIPSISDSIADAFRDSPSDADSKSLENQFEMLIERPLSGYSTRSATDVRAIVIDALDECDARRAIGQAMKLWPKLGAHTTLNLRVFVTSRSDVEIRGTLGQLDPKYLHYEKLEDWQLSTIEDDLRLFCNDELRKLREQSRNESSYDELEDDWPGELVIDKLVEVSKPLFIAASTILRDAKNDPGRLEDRVNGLRSTGTKALTAIYLDILNQAAKFDDDWLDWFGQVIKPFALLHSSLTIPALADLLGGNTMVANALNPLSSVIEFPSGKEVKAGSRATVRAYHESFRDFLMDSSLKNHPEFWIDKGETHGILQIRCMDLLKNKLGRDVCKQKHPATKRKDVSAEHVEKHIPESVQYACRYWTSHAIHSNETIEDGGQVDRFLRTFLLHWTEAMAWLDKLGEMVLCLKQLQQVIDSQSSPRLYSFVADALRWVPENRNMISEAPLHAYLSALAFAPSNSVVKYSFKHEMDDFLQVWSPVESDWGPVLQTFRHSATVLSIAPSIDGRKLVTIAADETVRLWDIESGTEDQCLEVGSCSVASTPSQNDDVIIAGDGGELWRWKFKEEVRRVDLKLPANARRTSVSSDGRYAAWSLYPTGVYIWDTVNNTGEVIQEHDVSPSCMVFSSDNETVFWGSTTISRWSAKAGHETVCRANDVVRKIAVLPHDNSVIFWSQAGGIWIFCSDSQRLDLVMEAGGYIVLCLLVTPDSRKVLISTNSCLFLYDFETRSEPITLLLDDLAIKSMAFSPDGRTIWAGHRYGSVLQMDANLALKSRRLETGTATVALSTDCRWLVSLSQDKHQLSLWSTETQTCKQRLSDQRLLGPMSTDIVVSSNNRWVVVPCVSTWGCALIWDLESNKVRVLVDEPMEITALAISPKSETLVCGFSEGQIRTFDLTSGIQQNMILGHSKIITKILFSPDGQLFASVPYEYDRIKIWSLQSQTLSVQSEASLVQDALFSADGRKLYTINPGEEICELDVENTCKRRELGHYDINVCHHGSILIDGSFGGPVLPLSLVRLEANDADHAEIWTNLSAPTKAFSITGNRELWALENDGGKWITVNGQKLFKLPGQLAPRRWISCGRAMVITDQDNGFTVLQFTGKISF